MGWPPVRSFRKNTFQANKNKTVTETTGDASSAPGLFVKVSMDGAPYLRKIDLSIYKGYKELRHALDTMFKCFSTTTGTNRIIDLTQFRKDNSQSNLRSNFVFGYVFFFIGDYVSEYSVAYEDKDGDLMLAGDVPWE